MKEIPLTQGKVALVDDEDFGWLTAMGKWTADRQKDGRYYAIRFIGHRPNLQRISMHRAIMREPDGEVDHRDNDGLNNQRDNLRVASRSQQTQNNQKRRGARSRFKGVQPTGYGWSALIKKDGRTHYVGHFPSEEQAARAYDAKAREMFGEFGCFNFPNENERGALV